MNFLSGMFGGGVMPFGDFPAVPLPVYATPIIYPPNSGFVIMSYPTIGLPTTSWSTMGYGSSFFRKPFGLALSYPMTPFYSGLPYNRAF